MERVVDVKIVENPKMPLSMNPKKFGLWIFMATVLMLFMSLTSAYLVKRADGNWLFFELPNVLYFSSLMTVLSSVTMQWTYYSVKDSRLFNAKIGLLLTTIFGLLFLGSQFRAWQELVLNNVYLVGNAAGSFVYVITGLHGIHIISALVFLGIMWFSILGRKKKKLDVSFEMCTTYWHFLGALWLYLFGFFILFR